mmetsp:Transcript_3182/g.7451  ORF Transcript_3182/g.7451 Transcript_3182/m.7451 type:complete len:214 (-) Transcript_3182:254-895(-)
MGVLANAAMRIEVEHLALILPIFIDPEALLWILACVLHEQAAFCSRRGPPYRQAHLAIQIFRCPRIPRESELKARCHWFHQQVPSFLHPHVFLHFLLAGVVIPIISIAAGPDVRNEEDAFPLFKLFGSLVRKVFLLALNPRRTIRQQLFGSLLQVVREWPAINQHKTKLREHLRQQPDVRSRGSPCIHDASSAIVMLGEKLNLGKHQFALAPV